MPFPPQADNGFCTIDDLLTSLPRLGLPHFQRGQVWGSSAVSRLLESLMMDTPCGSILLWVPDGLSSNPVEFGVGIQEWGTTTPEFLVVDGQQRLTALARVFRPGSRWALNLACLPEFAPYFTEKPSDRLRSRNLFVERPEPPNAEASESVMGRHKAETRDLVLLSKVLEGAPDLWPYSAEPPAQWAMITERIRAIRTQQLQVVVKRGEGLEGIVRLYNRINSSGVVVREEERAFAAMVRFNPAAGSWLRSNFIAVHQETSENETTRNDVLKHQRESQFGFRLFIRTFAQAAAHHMGRDTADLSQFDEWLWDEKWMKDEGKRLQVFEEAGRVLVRAADVLRGTLRCDDFRFVPSAEALRPVFALMLKFPVVEDAVLGRCLVTLQLDSSVVEKRRDDKSLVADIRRANTLQEALSAFPTLRKDGRLLESLRGVQSMQDRWVSLLYWLQRSLGACDYDAGGVHTPLNAEARAHKEHIVPFSLLRPAYKDLEARGGHGRSHIANAIGNLTFLSEKFNFDHGADPIRLWDVDKALLVPHQLGESTTLEAYRRAIDHLLSARMEEGRLAYEQFVEGRLRVLARDMHAWLHGWEQAVPVDLSRRPMPQLVHRSAADGVREFGWPTRFEDAVLCLLEKAGRQGKYWLLYRQGEKSARTRTSNQIRLAKDGRSLSVGKDVAHCANVHEALSRHITPKEFPDQWHFPIDPVSEMGADALDALRKTMPWPEPKPAATAS